MDKLGTYLGIIEGNVGYDALNKRFKDAKVGDFCHNHVGKMCYILQKIERKRWNCVNVWAIR